MRALGLLVASVALAGCAVVPPVHQDHPWRLELEDFDQADGCLDPPVDLRYEADASAGIVAFVPPGCVLGYHVTFGGPATFTALGAQNGSLHWNNSMLAPGMRLPAGGHLLSFRGDGGLADHAAFVVRIPSTASTSTPIEPAGPIRIDAEDRVEACQESRTANGSVYLPDGCFVVFDERFAATTQVVQVLGEGNGTLTFFIDGSVVASAVMGEHVDSLPIAAGRHRIDVQVQGDVRLDAVLFGRPQDR